MRETSNSALSSSPQHPDFASAPGVRARTLPEAFSIQSKDVISFVGGGGKTAAMFRLAADLADLGWRVISTTTTHLGRDESSRAPRHWWSESVPILDDALLSELKTRRHLLVTGPPIEAGERWAGVTSEWVADAILHPLVDVILVEADGARDLPFKAPASHEPVVPPITTLLVPVVGVDAVGRTIAEAAHRPEQVCSLTQLTPQDEVTPAAIATVLAHPAGGMKLRPPDARVCVLINKVESDEGCTFARDIAHHLLYPSVDVVGTVGQAPVSTVVIASLQSEQPIVEVRRRVAAVVLAAGCSTRMAGEVPKQLLPWQGKTVVEQVVERLSTCPLAPLLVVVGHYAEQVHLLLASTGARSVYNPHYDTGEMLSSLKVALSHLDSTVSGCLVFLVDQPWIQASLVERMLEGYASTQAGLIAPAYHGRRGHPVLIDRRYWPELLDLEPGFAPRHLLERHSEDLHLIPVDTDSILDDMDTMETYRQALEKYGAG